MRSILSLSLPAEMLADIRRQAKHAGMSISAYAQRVFRWHSHLITEDELLKRSKEATKNYRRGKYKVLKSSDDLDQPW